MIELCAITHNGPDGASLQSAVIQSIPHGRRLVHQKTCRENGVLMLVAGDEPVDAFVFEGPRFSLICRADLLAAGATGAFKGQPASYLAGLYEKQGDSFVKNVRGTFAIVVYDHQERVVKAWADHFGTQSVAFTDGRPGPFGVSTDLRMLLPSLREQPQPDPSAIQQYLLYSCIPGPKTIYKGISRLQPGYQLISGQTPAARPYWDMTYPAKSGPAHTEEAWADRTFEAMQSAVAGNLTGVDPSRLGCFLSGGTDSSSIVGLAGKVTGQPPHTFSIGFDDPRYNEIEYARIAAKHYHTDHHEYFVSPQDILALIDKAVPAFDEPFGNSSIIPTYYCARLAAENGMSHLLAGDGGDEVFGGNSRYVDDRIFQRYASIPSAIRRGLIEPVVSIAARRTSVSLFDKVSRYIQRSNIPLPDRLFSYSVLSSIPQAELFTGDFLASLGAEHPLAPARRHFAAAPATSDLNRWLYLDLKMTIGDNDLRKVTTMSRLAGIDTRYPMLDPALAEFSGTIPANLKVKGQQLRYLFKKAMARILPGEIITKSKHGFGLPFSAWLGENKPLYDFTMDTLGSARCRQRGYFREDLVEWLLPKYQFEHKYFYGEAFWLFLMLELWQIRQHDSVASGSPQLTIS